MIVIKENYYVLDYFINQYDLSLREKWVCINTNSLQSELEVKWVFLLLNGVFLL